MRPYLRACCPILLAAVTACATTPRSVVPAVTIEQKLGWILQLEDQRILELPAPPAPAPPPGRRTQPAAAPAAGPSLARLATDADPRVRRRAAIAIGRVGLKEGVAALTPLVADTDAEVRQAAAFALGLVGDPAASASLVPLLADPAPLIRGRAAEALGLLAARNAEHASVVQALGKEASPAIAAMVREYARSPAVTGMQPDAEGWPIAAEAEAFKLGLFALVRLRSYDGIAAAVLDESGRPVSTWWPLAYALQRSGDRRAVPALRQLVQIQGRYTPAFAARGLGVSKDPAAADVLLPLLDPSRASREVVAAAIRAVAQIGASAAVPALSSIVADPAIDPNLRLEAVMALGTLKAADALPVIQDRLIDEWPAMRAAALRAAAAIDQDNLMLVLSGLEADRHWVGRAALADVLATLPADMAIPRVRALLQDQDKRVIPAALRALVALRAPDADQILLAHLKDADFAVRETAARLLGQLEPAGGLEALREAYKAGLPDSAYGARAAALSALAAYGGPEAIEAVKMGLADKDWAVRLHAVDLLETLAPGVDHRLAIRPAPVAEAPAYGDPQLVSPPYSPHVFIETGKGTIEFELAVLDAPLTARNFMALARKGYFNGLQVHRVVPNFVVQDGDPRGDGEGGPGYTIRDELNDRPYLRGTVGMALAWRDTGGSQFFITHSPQPHLDGLYTAFGHVVNGIDVVDRLQWGDVIQRVRVWDGTGWQ